MMIKVQIDTTKSFLLLLLLELAEFGIKIYVYCTTITITIATRSQFKFDSSLLRFFVVVFAFIENIFNEVKETRKHKKNLDKTNYFSAIVFVFIFLVENGCIGRALSLLADGNIHRYRFAFE